jgi:hypothetical protein
MTSCGSIVKVGATKRSANGKLKPHGKSSSSFHVNLESSVVAAMIVLFSLSVFAIANVGVQAVLMIMGPLGGGHAGMFLDFTKYTLNLSTRFLLSL